MKQPINEIKRMQVLAGILTEAQLDEMTFDQIALDHPNTAPNTPPGATPGTAPEQASGKMKEGMGNFKEVPANDKVSGKSIVTDGRNYYVYKTSIGASNDNTALFVYDMKGKELKKYDLVKDKTTIEEDDILMAAVEALKSIGGRNGLGLNEGCDDCDREGTSWVHGQDHEASMADSELRDLISNASKLQNMIEPGDELPGWASAYITLAADYMHSVAEYMEGKSAEMGTDTSNNMPQY